jgi:hypothetical protein
MINSRVSVRGTGNHLGRKIDIVLEGQFWEHAKALSGKESSGLPAIYGAQLKEYNSTKRHQMTK